MARDTMLTTSGLEARFSLDAPVVDVDTYGRASTDRRDAFETLRYLHATACRYCGSDEHYDDDCGRPSAARTAYRDDLDSRTL